VASLATRLARTPVARGAVAVGVAGLVFATMAGPVWSRGLLEALPAGQQQLLARVILAPDALAGVADTVVGAAQCTWGKQTQSRVSTLIGHDLPNGPVRWWMPAVVWWAAAGALAGVLALRHWLGRMLYGT